jgi:hypothetical protein
MRHENGVILLRSVFETVQAAPFPVYGLHDHPFDHSVSSHGLGISHLGFLISVTFTFTSPRYSDSHPRHSYKSKNFEITSIDAATQRPEREHMAFDLEEPSEGQVFNDHAGWLFQDHHFSEEEQKQAGSPLIWTGTFSLVNAIFSGKILSWNPPLHISTFLLKSEETILVGNAYGPSNEELIQLLKSLQVINHQDDLLRRYQREVEKTDR